MKTRPWVSRRPSAALQVGLQVGKRVGSMLGLAAAIAVPLHAAMAAADEARAAPGQTSPARPAEPVRIALIEGMSGPFANAGQAVERNLRWAVERVNARGGLKLPDGRRPMELLVMDGKGNVEDSLLLLRTALSRNVVAVLQGNSSAVASALSNALDRSSEREPEHRALFLNYSAVSPDLTNEHCSPWHFRFDAHADMRMKVLVEEMARDAALDKVWLVAQDYSFGHDVLRSARTQLGQRRPDVKIVGETLHPVGRVKDFAPYVRRIVDSGAGAIVTGNWGNDLTLLIRAARDAGFEGRYYTFYGNALGVPGTLGDAGVDRVVAVAEWFPNVQDDASRDFYRAFRARYPDPAQDYVHLRMQQVVEMLALAIERAGGTDAVAVGKALAGMQWPDQRTDQRPDAPPAAGLGDPAAVQGGTMRAADHQFLQPLYAALMGKAGTREIPFDVEGSGYGFRTLRRHDTAQVTLPHSCRMAPWPEPQRPDTQRPAAADRQ